jgi:LPXTG-site transpeptidase (sortase) family protein
MKLSDFFRVTPKSRKVKLKKKKGVLFSNPGFFRRTIFYTGSWLLVVAFGYVIYLYYPLGKAIIRYKIAISENNQKPNQVMVVPTPTPVPAAQQKQEYNITIPKILAFANIAENIDPFNRDEYLKVLGSGLIAQAKDTSLPGLGIGHMTYLFAHSTSEGLNMLRINSVFYLLGELNDGDVIFVVKNGFNYTYKVYKQLVVNANQIEYLKYSEPDREIIILQTCWPIGTNWKRLLVFAERV